MIDQSTDILKSVRDIFHLKTGQAGRTPAADGVPVSSRLIDQSINQAAPANALGVAVPSG